MSHHSRQNNFHNSENDNEQGPFEVLNDAEQRVEGKVDRVTIAGILLIIVFLLGIFTAVLYSVFISAVFPLESNGKFTLSGQVIDKATGRAIEGANVTLVGEKESTRTLKNGWFYFSELPEGDYEIKVSKEGYSTVTKKITLRESAKVVTFRLEKGGEDRTVDERSNGNGVSNICPAIVIAFSIIALIGGISALQKINFRLAVVGGVFGTFSFGLIIGSLLSVIALILILTSKKSFSSKGECSGDVFEEIG